MTIKHYNHELTTLCAAVRQAGERVLQLTRDGFETHIKPDHSPVTSADLEVNRILQEILIGTYPDDGWLSEETPDDLNRLEKKRVWVLDPIDGTSYFIKGIPEYGISAALVEDEKPVVAVVFNPATDELFAAVRQSGATLNGRPMFVRSQSTERISVFVNAPTFKKKTVQEIEKLADCHPLGSIAYTLALAACGKVDATINLWPQNEWDIAAGTLLVQEAGGMAVDTTWSPIRFNQPKTIVNGIIATRSDKIDVIQDLIKKITEE